MGEKAAAEKGLEDFVKSKTAESVHLPFPPPPGRIPAKKKPRFSNSTVAFPVFEEKHLIESTKNYPVSFNGKMRFTMELPLDLSKEAIEKAVMTHEKTQAQLAGRTPKKIIVVPGRIVNIVG